MFSLDGRAEARKGKLLKEFLEEDVHNVSCKHLWHYLLQHLDAVLDLLNRGMGYSERGRSRTLASRLRLVFSVVSILKKGLFRFVVFKTEIKIAIFFLQLGAGHFFTVIVSLVVLALLLSESAFVAFIVER